MNLLLIKNMQMLFLSIMAIFILSGCLQTRSDVSAQDQNAVYAKKNAENQLEAQAEAQAATSVVDEKDELIRNLNGRVEVLESQLMALQEAKAGENTQNSQKILLLQEALTKMEVQLQSLMNEGADNKITEPQMQSSDELAAAKAGVKSDEKKVDEKEKNEIKNKKLGSYETAEQYYAKRDWKKAIISFQKYTDESPRGKHVADAKYKIGLCFQELGMKEEAMAFYEEVVANYAKTEAGKKSKARLAKIKNN